MFLSTSLISKLALLTAAVNGALVRVTDFGTNPTNLQMNIWVPSKLAAKPAIILAVR
jgi:acetylxylan esterase